ncbi:MAG: hypothetical protein JO112_02895 [Planctomycetes bacterium]|nr:hypothetical protein [Planctomycetota bacterium]
MPSFPRAVLGLPIGFHFADGPGKGKPAKRHLDPADVELRPDLGRTATGKVEGSRMASPVITKALFFQGSWVPAVLLLPHDHALAVAAVLEGKQALPPGNPLSRIVPNSQIVGPQQGRLTPMAGHGNAIEALIDFLGRTTDGQGNPKEVFREEHG